MENKETHKTIEPSPKPVRLFFFWAGFIATIAYRIIILLNLHSPSWVKIAWYIGTIGFVLYFGHRFRIARKKSKLIKEYNIVETIDKAECIDPRKKEILHYLAKTTVTSKARWNSAIIFFLSLAALLLGIFLDVFGI
jgi:hypothetical protein